MTKTHENIQANAEFIKNTLEKNFNQTVDPDRLKVAARKLCDAIPATRATQSLKKDKAA